MEENPLNTLSNPLQILPNPSPDGSQIPPEALLEPILGQCLKEAQFWMAKERPSDGQKHPKEAQDHPKPLPKGAQDPSKIDFCWIFKRFLSSSNFALIFLIFFCYFLQPEPLKTIVFPQ